MLPIATQHAIAHMLVVYDFRNPARPKKLGHFNAPNLNITAMTATSDGEVDAGCWAP